MILKKIVSLIFLIQNDENLIKEIEYSKNDINRLNFELKKKILVEGHTSYIKNQEESIIERILNK